ncbi:Succinate dehydrogenase assembly factor 2, mitochondrial [Lamellibrachia satsuma]|nr:Succinate dehydrogenase assembly factor 2, mitochondrial [Lamellibrachia satsuma]
MSVSRILQSGLRCVRISRAAGQCVRSLSTECSEPPTGPLHTPEHVTEPTLPDFVERVGETSELKKARLVYQSRKRGMLENGILLSTFVDRYLDDMNDKQLRMYDLIINKPGSDWDIYYWMIGSQPAPEEFDNEVMDMLKHHAENEGRELRTGWPELK